MLDFMDGVGNYTTIASAVLGKWGSVIGAEMSTASGLGREGGYAIKCNAVSGTAAAPGSYLSRTYPSSVNRRVLGVAFRVDTFDATQEVGVIQWCDVASIQVQIGLLPTGQLRVRDGANNVLGTTSAPVITQTGVYNYLEADVTFNSTTGAVTIRNNGVQVLALTQVNTARSGNNSANTLRIGGLQVASGLLNATSLYYFCDLYTLVTTGTYNTGFLGDSKVLTLFPTADGSNTAFTPSPSGAHFSNVNQQEQDGDTTYNYDANSGDIDSYAHTASPSNTGTIFGVQLNQVSRKDDIADRSTANYLLSSASVFTGTTTPLTSAYAWHQSITEVDPATSAPFTKAALDATEIGVTVAA